MAASDHDSRQELPAPDGQCHARTRGKKSTRCLHDATEAGAGYLCTQHRDKLRSNPGWPLDARIDAHRVALCGRVGATPPSPPSGKQSGGFLSNVTGLKVLGSGAIVTAAFLSEYFFLAPFNIDYSFFLASIEAVPLFIRNLSAILVFSVLLFFIVSLVVVLGLALQSLPAGVRGFRDELQHANRKKLAELEEETRVCRKAIQDALWAQTRATKRRGDIDAELRSIDTKATPGGSLLRVARTLWARLANRPTRAASGTKQDQDSAERVEQLRRSLERTRHSLGDEIRAAQQSVVEAEQRIEEVSESRRALKRKLNSLNGSFFVPAREHLRRALRNKFSGPVPAVLNHRWAQALLLACVVGLPLTVSYFDGKTMALCVETLSSNQADEVSLVCPDDGTAYWQRDVLGWQEDPVSHLVGGPGEPSLADRIVAGIFATARNKLFFGVRNYPVVSVTFKELDALTVATANRSSDAMSCLASRANPTQRLIAETGFGKCALVEKSVSARMLYLGEAGAWTLLHSLNRNGKPLFAKTAEISAISFDPISSLASRNETPDESKPQQSPIVEFTVQAAHMNANISDRVESRLSNIETLVASALTTPSKVDLTVGLSSEATRLVKKLVERTVPVVSADLELPAKFIGVEARLAGLCTREKPSAVIPFDRNQTQYLADDEEVFGLIEKVVEDASRKASQHEQLTIVVEGTADSVGTPAINVEFSEARASFVHKAIERAILMQPAQRKRLLEKNVSVVSYGSGEWAQLPAGIDGQARAVIVSLCTHDGEFRHQASDRDERALPGGSMNDDLTEPVGAGPSSSTVSGAPSVEVQSRRPRRL